MSSRVFPAVMLIAMILTAAAAAEVPQIINYQGRLTDSLGNPVTDGSYQMAFSIYDDPSSGPAFWTSGSQPVQVTNGLFEYQLGSAVLLPINTFDSDTVRYLGITIGDGDELTPRIRFTSVAYAYRSMVTDTAVIALSVDGSVITSVNLQDGTIQLIDLGQNGASAGQIIKWNGSAWQVADDLSAAGWSDDGNIVRLESTTDSVGIGTATPQAKLDVNGRIRADAGYANENAIEGYAGSDMSAVYGENAIGTEGGLGGVDAGVWGSSSGGLWAGQFNGKTYTSGPFAIGISSPATLFHMHGANPVLTIGTTTDFAGLRIRKYSTDKWEFAWNETSGYLYLKNYLGAGTVMVIEDVTGEVGFGTTSPAGRVHGLHPLGSYGILGAPNTGVLGSAPGAGYGVKGDSENGYAIYGSTSGDGYGVYGANSHGGYGYLGGDYAVYGHNPGEGAGFFDGVVFVTEQLGIGPVPSINSIFQISDVNPIPVLNTTDYLALWRYKVNSVTQWETGYNANEGRFYFKNAAYYHPTLSLYDNGNISIAYIDPISALDVNGDIHIRNYNRGINWSPTQAMPFGTWDGTTFTERMRFAADGKVGINTNNPLDQLHIYGNVRIDGGGGAFLRFTDGGDLRWSWLYKSWANTTFQLWNEVGGYAVMAFNETTGNVGINTTTPGAKLDVNGDVNVSGNLTVSGSSPFPAPNYDSGWIPISAGDSIILTHGLGVDANKYVVDFQAWHSVIETHNHGIGEERYYNPSEDQIREGSYFSKLNTSTIMVHRGRNDYGSEKVRIRIWVYQ